MDLRSVEDLQGLTATPPKLNAKITASGVNVYYGDKHALKDVNVEIADRGVMRSSGRLAAGSLRSSAASTG